MAGLPEWLPGWDELHTGMQTISVSELLPSFCEQVVLSLVLLSSCFQTQNLVRV